MATFGKTNVGANTDTLPAGYIQAIGPYSPATNGTVTSISLYTVLSAGVFTLNMYGETAGAPGALKGVTAQGNGTTAGWVTINVTTPFAVTAGTNYYIGYTTNFLTTMKSDNDAGKTGFYKTNTYSAGAAPDPFPAGYSTQAVIDSIYATYTEDATGHQKNLLLLGVG